MKQQWFCEKCDTKGSVDYEKGELPYSVVYKLEDSHKERSPNCDQPVRRLRVVVD